MSKRIFTKRFSGFVYGMAAPEVGNAIESLLLQEDIEVIGAEIVVYTHEPSQNDGFAYAEVELSQVGERGKDGIILAAAASEWWNTTPAGISLQNGHVAIAFPLGLVVPVREEGYLYINSYTVGKSAGLSTFHYTVIVFYTKGSSRRK